MIRLILRVPASADVYDVEALVDQLRQNLVSAPKIVGGRWILSADFDDDEVSDSYIDGLWFEFLDAAEEAEMEIYILINEGNFISFSPSGESLYLAKNEKDFQEQLEDEGMILGGVFS